VLPAFLVRTGRKYPDIELNISSGSTNDIVIVNMVIGGTGGNGGPVTTNGDHSAEVTMQSIGGVKHVW